jgi:hypothetical protein
VGRINIQSAEIPGVDDAMDLTVSLEPGAASARLAGCMTHHGI